MKEENETICGWIKNETGKVIGYYEFHGDSEKLREFGMSEEGLQFLAGHITEILNGKERGTLQ